MCESVTYFDLYGAREMTADELQRVAAEALDVVFEARESSSTGPYFSADVGRENFAIHHNFRDERPEDEVLRPEFADYPVLLFVNRSERGDEIRELLVEIPGLDHLKRDTRD